MDANPIETNGIPVIELHMMDKRKYYPLALLSGFTIRTCLYPVSLIRTRLQIQKQTSMYNGLFDAFAKIYAQEGIKGYYKGFWVNSLMIFSQFTYITVYEHSRQYMAKHTRFTDKKIRAFTAGGCASLVSQTFMVPIDIVSQHLQMQGTQMIRNRLDPISVPESAQKSRLGAVTYIVKGIYKNHGLQGFYRGYAPSLLLYGSQSAFWWMLYDTYCDIFGAIAPVWFPRLSLQAVAGPCSGVTACLLTNPLDVVRARVQVQNTKVLETSRVLWNEEGVKIFTKGVSARMTQSVIFSFFIIVGYESIKRMSILEEYKDDVRW